MKSRQHQTLMNSKKFPLPLGQQGGVLIEFALISLVFYVLVALVVDIGRMIFTSQVLQDAARVAARELALIPLPPDTTFAQALQDPTVVAQLFDPSELVIDVDSFATDADFHHHLDGLPILNKVLRPLMIVEQVEIQGTPRNLLRYPGALLVADDTANPVTLTVGIPRVETRGADGLETIRWVGVVEEITNGSFSVASPLPQRGLAAVRINYPFQAAILSGFQQNAAGPFEPNLDNEILADDENVTESNAPSTGAVLGAGDFAADAVGTYAGPYGLGRQLALGQTLRPFRKLLSAQAIFRREVFN